MSIPILALNLVQVMFGGSPLHTLRRYWPILLMAMPIGGVVGFYSSAVSRDVLVALLGTMVVFFSVLSLAQWCPEFLTAMTDRRKC